MHRSLLATLLLAVSSTASAIVIRDDVDDSAYRIEASAFPALADMPGEGHGVLIDPQWVVTAAHTLPHHADGWTVDIAGSPRAVAQVVIHPGYKTLPQELVDQAMATGEAMLVLVFLAASDDIALVRLQEPVTDIAPVPLHRAAEEFGRVAKIIGKGATGTGDVGHDPKGPNRTTLRRAFNTITSAHGRWLCHVFDAPPAGLPQEGITGNGDSGGPVLVEVGDRWELAGLAAWKFFEGHVLESRPGRYGQINCAARVSHHAAWIDGVIAGSKVPKAGDSAGATTEGGRP